MSTSDANPTSPWSGIKITYPPGASAGAARETSQTTPQGAVVQGMLFPVTLASGTVTNVFVPYSILNSPATVQALFDQRLGAIMAIGG